MNATFYNKGNGFIHVDSLNLFFWVALVMTLCDPSCVYVQKRLFPSHTQALLSHMISEQLHVVSKESWKRKSGIDLSIKQR